MTLQFFSTIYLFTLSVMVYHYAIVTQHSFILTLEIQFYSLPKCMTPVMYIQIRICIF